MTAVPESRRSVLDIPGHFADLPDPRHPAFREHHLFGEIVTIALCAVLSGATSWDTIASIVSGRSRGDIQVVVGIW